MENCNVCKHKSINTVENNFLCKIHGPMQCITICEEFQKDERKINVNKCNNCSYFKQNISLEKGLNMDKEGVIQGTCLKYLLRPYNGCERLACSYFIEIIPNIITDMEEIVPN